MKKMLALAAAALALLPITGMASSGHNPFIEPANIDLNNQAAIQRGSKYFANYCMGCHSAQYVRYQLMEKAGLSAAQIKDNLIFNESKIGGLMTIAMPREDGARWFGAPAPDLTLEARLRGSDWIYSYLKGFYTDPSRPMGVNNTVFHNVGMPNILWQLEGIKEPAYRYDVMHEGHKVASFNEQAEAEALARQKGEGYKVHEVIDHLVLVKPGILSPAEFDQTVRDLTTYLTFIAEPMKLERQRMGVWVVGFLVLFSILAFMMKKEWWKDIH